jgi:arylsulfatase A-like enzyme
MVLVQTKKFFPMNRVIYMLVLSLVLGLVGCNQKEEVKRPNILFCIADDWGWPHAGAYGDPVVKTPTFDRLATEGVLFENAYVSSPSCTASRSAILTGQQFWRLDESANLWSTLDTNHPVYPLLLEKKGYHIGFWRKSWGPGELEVGGYDTIHPAGKEYSDGFETFLKEKPADSPFCFWLGASDPHRPYEKGSGVTSGIDTSKVELPGFFPDAPEIKSDLADYYYEVQRFDSDVAAAINLLDRMGELDNTIIVVTGDHGMPFPRCKSNLYDLGVRVPLAVRWGDKIEHVNRRVKNFVSLTDLAPTFLALAGVEIPQEMTGKSLESILMSDATDSENPEDDHIVFGRERHVPGQLIPSMDGYPSRGIRTADYLYIKNFHPERWPAGVPDKSTHPFNTYGDCDDGPTKEYFLMYQDDPDFETYFNWSFAKRPAEELYLTSDDPDQLNNLASDPAYESVRRELSARLMEYLRDTGDPRGTGENVKFDNYPYRAPYALRTLDSLKGIIQ